MSTLNRQNTCASEHNDCIIFTSLAPDKPPSVWEINLPSQSTIHLYNQYNLVFNQATHAAHQRSEAKCRIASIEFEFYLCDLRGYLRSSNKACKGTIFNGVLKLLTCNSRFPSPKYQKKSDLSPLVRNIDKYQQKDDLSSVVKNQLIVCGNPTKETEKLSQFENNCGKKIL